MNCSYLARYAEWEKFEKEQTMCKDLANMGHKIEHLSDINRPKGETYDIHYDGEKADLKSVSSHNNIEKYVKHAVRDQGAKTVIVRIEDSANRGKVMNALNSAKRKYGHTIKYYFQSEKKLRDV